MEEKQKVKTERAKSSGKAKDRPLTGRQIKDLPVTKSQTQLKTPIKNRTMKSNKEGSPKSFKPVKTMESVRSNHRPVNKTPLKKQSEEVDKLAKDLTDTKKPVKTPIKNKHGIEKVSLSQRI